MRLIRVLLLSLVLAGCATTEHGAEPAAEAKARQYREATLLAIDHWQLQGRLAIRTGDEGFSAGIEWRQSGRSFDIRLTDPLGRRLAWIQGNPEQVNLITANGSRHEAVEPTALLQQHLGWSVPLDSLRFWVIGLADPALPLQAEAHDQLGRPVTLQQMNWQVALSRYDSSLLLAMPELLTVSREDFRARLLVEQRRQSTADNS